MSKKSNTPVVSETVESENMDIKQILAETGLSNVYVRRAISTGALPAHKEPVKEGSTTVKNVITREDFNKWRAESAAHSRREDGRAKFVIYMTADEEVQAREKLAGLPFIDLMQRANVKPEASPEAEA